MFDTVHKHYHHHCIPSGECGLSPCVVGCPNDRPCDHTNFHLRFETERAYWRGYSDAMMRAQERRGYYPRTKSEEEMIEILKKGLKPLDDARKELGI